MYVSFIMLLILIWIIGGHIFLNRQSFDLDLKEMEWQEFDDVEQLQYELPAIPPQPNSSDWQIIKRGIRLFFMGKKAAGLGCVSGKYKGMPLIMKRLYANNTVVEISISLRTPIQRVEQTSGQRLDENRLTKDEIHRRLVPTKSRLVGIHRLKVNQARLVYQTHLETDVDKLCSIFDYMIELAENYQQVLALGTVAARGVTNLTNSHSGLRHVALALLFELGDQSSKRFASKIDLYLCSGCLAKPAKFTKHTRKSVALYGCRLCQKSSHLLHGIPTAVLDDTQADLLTHQHGRVEVNWLMHRQLFDFSQVKIVVATDQAVERFVMQVENDTDVTRKNPYHSMPVFIHDQCHLSENTLRLLRRYFGSVEMK